MEFFIQPLVSKEKEQTLSVMGQIVSNILPFVYKESQLFKQVFFIIHQNTFLRIPAVHEKPLAFRTLMGTKDNGSIHVAGNDVAERAQFSLSEPVVKGVIQNFDHMEQIWSDCFKVS